MQKICRIVQIHSSRVPETQYSFLTEASFIMSEGGTQQGDPAATPFCGINSDTGQTVRFKN